MYVDAYFDRKKDKILVVERDHNGKRVFKDFKVDYNFYYEDPEGEALSIFDTKLKHIRCRSTKAFKQKLSEVPPGRRLFESDVNQVFSTLSTHYLTADAPKLHVAFVDIETDKCPERGYSSPEEAFMPITSVAIYQQWLNRVLVYTVPPPNIAFDDAVRMLDDMPNVTICRDDSELLHGLLDALQDCDVVSGWNSKSYDIPYIVNRIKNTIGDVHCRKLCLWGTSPREKEYDKYGELCITYTLTGRVHYDYMDLYIKFRGEERHSYKLDYIGEIEVEERKVEYNGTLDQLYRNDYRLFVQYNIQDVNLLDKIDKKLGYIELANGLAHDSTVLLPTVLGSVAAIEQSLINEAHLLGKRVMSKKDHHGDTKAAGAYVAYPKKGRHKKVGSVDINSLYPSTIRSLNMSNETIIGQIKPDYTRAYLRDQIVNHKKKFAEAWEGKFACLEYDMVMNEDTENTLTLALENGETYNLTGAEIYKTVFESKLKWAISANGTIFDLSKTGLIPSTLSKWYTNRKQMQAKEKWFEAFDKGYKIDFEVEPIATDNKIMFRRLECSEFDLAVKSKDVELLGRMLGTYGMTYRDGYIYANSDDVEDAVDFWHRRQHVMKIKLNSAYGALLNEGCRFYDHRIGQSTTLSGRQIVKHMCSEINEIIAGEYVYDGEAIIYSDTDSCYFTAEYSWADQISKGDIEWDMDSVITIYDTIADEVNGSFPAFMKRAFNCQGDGAKIIKAGREIVASNTLFITKKRYAAMVVDKEGKRYDVNGKSGFIKAMGLDLRRSDTPIYIQGFLKETLDRVLTGEDDENIINYIRQFRKEFKGRNKWEMGSPRRVKNLSSHVAKRSKVGSQNIPGHVTASFNWNTLLDYYGDVDTMRITNGTKLVVCKLMCNLFGFDSIAYPIDEKRLPKWFTQLPFDAAEMEYTLIDKKLDNLVGVLDYDLRDSKCDDMFFSVFEWV